MATAQQLLQAMQQMPQQQQQFQQQLMQQSQQAIQQFGQLHVQPAQLAPAPALGQYNWVQMPEKFVAGDFIEFIKDYVRCSTAHGWNEQNRIQRLGPYLSCHALILFNTLRDDQKQTWADLASLYRLRGDAYELVKKKGIARVNNYTRTRRVDMYYEYEFILHLLNNYNFLSCLKTIFV